MLLLVLLFGVESRRKSAARDGGGLSGSDVRLGMGAARSSWDRNDLNDLDDDESEETTTAATWMQPSLGVDEDARR